MTEHPCASCPAKAHRGVIACPVAGAVLNKHRCRRVKGMAPDDAHRQLYRAFDRRWSVARESGDRRTLRFLRWRHRQGAAAVGRVLAPLTGAEQVYTLTDPIIVSARRRATSDDGLRLTDAVLSLPAQRGERVVRIVPAGNGHGDSESAVGRTDAPSEKRNGERTPRAMRVGQDSGEALPVALETEAALAGDALPSGSTTGRLRKRSPDTEPHQNRSRGRLAVDTARNAP